MAMVTMVTTMVTTTQDTAMVMVEAGRTLTTKNINSKRSG